jgi:UDP-N-acetylglucosamine 2-epimerase (non-hydrolysing)/GDP/UDP-N,N'-diacetylbacillosamine 2-epimerase (hydrolysing)
VSRRVRGAGTAGARVRAHNKRVTAKRRVCFVTGTRAEFGLMRTALQAIRDHPRLELQIVCTGMHLDPTHGRTVDTVRAEGWRVDAEVAWAPSGGCRARTAAATGLAAAELAGVYERLRTDVVLVVGDRVEPFAAASAAQIAGKVVAHVHGGDRALGQVDDALRHAITKLAHLHFPATRQSARRLRRMGEEAWRVVVAGSPGVDQIRRAAATAQGAKSDRFALVVYHPTDPDPGLEQKRAALLARAVRSVAFEQVVVVYPNNDPGAGGIIRCWEKLTRDPRFVVRRDVRRSEFLALMRDAAVMVGNSSSGIIEAASFGTPVVDVGPRQAGRERSRNVTNVPFDEMRIRSVLSDVWNNGRSRRSRAGNVYGGDGAGRRIAAALARLAVNDHLLRKLVAY